jgi:hypothetical protein
MTVIAWILQLVLLLSSAAFVIVYFVNLRPWHFGNESRATRAARLALLSLPASMMLTVLPGTVLIIINDGAPSTELPILIGKALASALMIPPWRLYFVARQIARQESRRDAVRD